jgi:hypothetical protein
MPHATPPGMQPPPPPVAEASPVERALGGSPGSVALRLVLLSLLVGVVLAVMGMTPWGFFHWVRYTIEEVLGTGLDAVRNLVGYVISGAIIVIPIWLILRLIARR